MKKYLLHNKFNFICFLVLKTMNIGILLAYSFLIRDLVNTAFEDNALQKLIHYIPFGIVYSLVLVLIYVLTSVVNTNYFNKSIYLMKQDYLHCLLKSKYQDIVKKDSSAYISALCNDAIIIRNNYFTAIFIMIDECITLIGSFICMFILDKLIAVIMVGIVFLVSVVPLFFKELINQANNKVSKALEIYTTGVKDVLGGIDVVKTYQLEDKMEGKLDDLNDDVRQSCIHRDYKGILLTSLTSSTTNIIRIGLIILTVYYVTKGRMDIGSVSAVLTLINYFFGPIESLTNQIGCIIGSRGVREKFLATINTCTVNGQEEKQDELCIKNNCDLFFIDHVSYQYNEERLILNNLSLEIEKGKKYLILGESGGGKSTLFKLLCKMYIGYDGDILFAGTNYNKLDEKQISKIVTYSHQKTYLFNDSIKNNIDILGTNDQEKLNRCIEICQLEGLISKLSNGFETQVSEEVDRLSEGEKLRIGLARAIYKDNPVLLLDEITASLDTTNSVEIENMILNINDKTVLNICHKFSKTIAKRYDQIVVIENGSIALMGDYDTVSRNPIFEKYSFNGL